MNLKRRLVGEGARNLLVVLAAVTIAPGDTLAYMQSPQVMPGTPAPKEVTPPGTPAPKESAPRIPADQLDSLVAPIALYPDTLLAQVLAASTYPLEIVQLQQWLGKNPGLKDKSLADAVAKQPWDPSIQAMAGLPDVVKRLADDIQWTTDLGNAFLAQQSDVMEAVQRMRKKGADAGHLKSNEQQKVETQVIESKQVIVIEQTNPQVVYVPSYNPVVVYGPPIYPYPPIYYPPPGYYAAGVAISFGVGIAMGAYWGGGWGCGWGGNNVYINHNNTFVRNSNNIGNGNIGNGNVGSGNLGNGNLGNGNVGSGNLGNGNVGSGNNNWQHKPEHRGGAPYPNQGTADRFGGTTRGDSVSNRQSNARQQIGAQGGNLASNRASGGAGVSDRTASAGAGNRAGGAGADRVGNRSLPSSAGTANRSAFGGSSQGYNGSSARASANRGSASMGSRGVSRGGGGRRR